MLPAECSGGVKVVSPERLAELLFDYILIAVGDESFGSVYDWFANRKAYRDKLIAIDMGEKPELDSVDVAVDDTFHEFISDNGNWNKTVEDYDRYWFWEKERVKQIRDDRPAAELLLKGYQYEKPVFHVLNERDEYKGSVSGEDLRILCSNCLDKIGTYSVGCVLRELNNNKINTDCSVTKENTIFDLYTLFVKRGLEEAVVLDGGRISHIIRRLDFQALFCRPMLNGGGLYLANRYHSNRLLPFHEHKYNVFSQTGEDGVIAHIFRVIGFQSCFAVEFGAWDGIHLSNIRNLILEHDVSALFIEGDSDKANDGIRNYEAFPKVKFAKEYVGVNKYRKLDDILHSNDVPENIDILSIDIDGWDYWVWDSLEDFRPRIVIVEFNATIYRDWTVISPSDEETRTGSSARAIVELGVRKGYELLCIVGANLIFCVREEFHKFGNYDNSLEALWPSSGLGSLFSTYNGDVYGDPWKRNGKGVLRPI